MKFDQDLCLNLQYDFGKMNSTLGSVVPLAMFSMYFGEDRGHICILYFFHDKIYVCQLRRRGRVLLGGDGGHKD